MTHVGILKVALAKNLMVYELQWKNRHEKTKGNNNDCKGKLVKEIITSRRKKFENR